MTFDVNHGGRAVKANWVTVHYNQKNLLDFLLVRKAQLMLNQLEDDEVWSGAVGEASGDEQRTAGRLKMRRRAEKQLYPKLF